MLAKNGGIFPLANVSLTKNEFNLYSRLDSPPQKVSQVNSVGVLVDVVFASFVPSDKVGTCELKREC